MNQRDFDESIEAYCMSLSRAEELKGYEAAKQYWETSQVAMGIVDYILEHFGITPELECKKMDKLCDMVTFPDLYVKTK